MEEAMTKPTDWLRVNNTELPQRLGRIRHVLFDFDGTLSVLRQGWEEVMIPVMLEAICGPNPIQPEIEVEVRAYVDRSSGILTIRQMQWLVEAVRRFGLVSQPRTAGEYKALYLDRLMVRVNARIASLEKGDASPASYLIAGAESFLANLVSRGAKLYLASGTDHEAVVREAEVLGIARFFEERIYGALDHNENHAKERVIQKILDENNLSGAELLVVGDGPVEIREGAQRGAITLGVASDEVVRCGWNPRKIERLENAGADLIVPDFCRSAELLALLFEPQAVS